ncbi:MAG: tilS [Rhizobacter sp.]|nr:tilS [Rhizobacter sp.]
MGVSSTPRITDLRPILISTTCAPCVAVAYSGGRDSTALLHATMVEGAKHGLKVVAIHVHHGLSPHADDWVEHCTRQCREWIASGLPVHFEAVRLGTAPMVGESVEAWARTERYAAIEAIALGAGASLVLLGHHRRDQAETFLLQSLRGAGVAGLSGMPREIRSGAPGADELVWSRPWLDKPREVVEAYLSHHGLAFIDDDSNADTRFARNRLRLDVWPSLTLAFPQAEASLARAARWAQEATSCLSDLAEMDLEVVATASRLTLDAFAALSPERRSNVLRYWIEEQTGIVAPAALVERLLDELPGKSPAVWAVPGGQLRRYRGVAWYQAAGRVARDDDESGGTFDEADHGLVSARQAGRLAGRGAGQASASSAGAPDISAGSQATVEDQPWSVRRAGVYKLPGWGGRFVVKRVGEGGIALSLLADARLSPRRGNEQFQAGPGRPPRSLKKQFQAMAVPEWSRVGPLVYQGERLLFVPGLGFDARAQAEVGVPRVELVWHVDDE